MTLQQFVENTLEDLSHAGLLRSPLTIQGPMGPTVRIDGREVLCLCSNNYLGLANHPKLVGAIQEAVAREGVGAGSSRLVSGTLEIHRRAENYLADFVGHQDALMFSSGYTANVGTVSALLTEDDIVFSDSLNHASLIDGCRLSKADVHVYHHRDMTSLESQLKALRHGGRNALVITEAVFSMDGDLAPLEDIRTLCDRYDAALMVDEAHSIGVLGPSGRGLCAARGIKADIVLGALGKSFGMGGAFIAASQSVLRFLINRARSFVFSTAVPPFMAAAAIVATDLVRAADDERSRVLKHATHLRDELRQLDFEVIDGTTPIIPVTMRDPVLTMQLSARLLANGVFVQGIRPPSVPSGTSRLRIAPMATHTEQQIEKAIDAFAELRRYSSPGTV